MRVPQDKAVQIFALQEELRQKHRRMEELLGQMTKAILHENHKDQLMEIFTPSTLIKLVRAHHKAVEGEQEVFTFAGDAWLVTYAAYLIEYLHERLKHRMTMQEELSLGSEIRRHVNLMKQRADGLDRV